MAHYGDEMQEKYERWWIWKWTRVEKVDETGDDMVAITFCLAPEGHPISALTPLLLSLHPQHQS